MDTAIAKANILIEALPYIRTFAASTFVIKLGGNAMADPALSRSFAMDLILLSSVGIRPVVVHGGGPQIGRLMERLGKQTEFVNGLRVTDQETIDIVEMVLVGKVNKEIVGQINANGGRAVGLSGTDGGLIKARKMTMHDQHNPGQEIDLGLVGEVAGVSPSVIRTLDEHQFIPVIAPLGCGPDGQTYNINADTAAGAIASALEAEKLILLTDVEGVKGRDGQLYSTLTSSQVTQCVADGTISGGMNPKTTCCCQALQHGVRKAHIIDGRVEHAVLLEIFTDGGVGTQIVQG